MGWRRAARAENCATRAPLAHIRVWWTSSGTGGRGGHVVMGSESGRARRSSSGSSIAFEGGSAVIAGPPGAAVSEAGERSLTPSPSPTPVGEGSVVALAAGAPGVDAGRRRGAVPTVAGAKTMRRGWRARCEPGDAGAAGRGLSAGGCGTWQQHAGGELRVVGHGRCLERQTGRYKRRGGARCARAATARRGAVRPLCEGAGMARRSAGRGADPVSRAVQRARFALPRGGVVAANDPTAGARGPRRRVRGVRCARERGARSVPGGSARPCQKLTASSAR